MPLTSQKYSRKNAPAVSAEEARSATERLLANPFRVTEDDIAAAQPSITFRLGSDDISVRAHIQMPPSSPGVKVLRSLPGVYYTRGERAYVVPAHVISDLVRSLRRAKCTFAFAAACGTLLQEGAMLREAILTGGETADEHALRKALLSPFVSLHPQSTSSSPLFMLQGVTEEFLAQFFSWMKCRRDRLAAANGFSFDLLLRALWGIKGAGFALFITDSATAAFYDLSAAVLSRSQSGEGACRASEENSVRASVEQVKALRHPPQRFWTVDKRGRPGLIVQAKAGGRYGRQGETWMIPPFQNGGIAYRFHPIRDNALLETVARVEQKSRLPKTRKFRAKVKQLEDAHARSAFSRKYRAMPDADPPIPDAQLKSKLFPHQRVAVEWLLTLPTALLGDDMGLGKTLSILSSYETLRSLGKADFLLVVCPQSLVRNWVREAETWISNLTLHTLPSNRRERDSMLALWRAAPAAADSCAGLVLHYELLRLNHVYPAIEALIRHRNSMLCIDESQRAKNPRSKTFHALKSIAGASERRVLLSGTPIPRDITDIWSQMYLIDGGDRLGRDYFRWLSSVAEIGNRWSKVAVTRFKPQAVKATIASVQEVLLRRTKDEVVSLPAKLFSVRDVPLHPDQRCRYQEICKQLRVTMTSIRGKQFTRNIDNVLEQYLRAVQVASNPRLIDASWSGEPAKFVELDEIVREVVGEHRKKVIIWTYYRKNVEELVQRYASYGALGFHGDLSQAERANAVEAFQEAAPCSSDRCSAVNILVAIPAAGGVGITLTAAQTVVYLEKTWNAEHWLQSIDRVHRIGQRGTVHIISLHSCPIDELIAKNLRKKQRLQARLLGDELGRDGECQGEMMYPSRSELMRALDQSSEMSTPHQSKSVKDGAGA